MENKQCLKPPTRLYMEVSKNGGAPIAGWFIMDNTIKIDDLWIPPFWETSIWCIYIYIYIYIHTC